MPERVGFQARPIFDQLRSRTRIALVLIYGMKERFLKNKGEITEIPGVVKPRPKNFRFRYVLPMDRVNFVFLKRGSSKEIAVDAV